MFVLLLHAGRDFAQIDYSFNVDTVNSDQYLNKIGYLERAHVYRSSSGDYIRKADFGHPVKILFTPYDLGDRQDGVYSVGDTVIYVTVERLKNDTMLSFEFLLNVELAHIKFKPAVKYFGMSEDMVQAQWEWAVKNMGIEKFKQYFRIVNPQAAAELDSINRSNK